MAAEAKPISSAAVRNYLTVDEFCDELGIARTTFDDWRAKGRAPTCLKLPSGRLRIRRVDIETWLDSCAQEAA